LKLNKYKVYVCFLFTGYAYVGTVCNVNAVSYRLSILEFTSFDLGSIAAHELGHA